MRAALRSSVFFSRPLVRCGGSGSDRPAKTACHGATRISAALAECLTRRCTICDSEGRGNLFAARLGLAAERPAPHRAAAPTFHAGMRCGGAMQDFDPSSKWVPLLDALAKAEHVFGPSAWDAIETAWRKGELPFRGEVPIRGQARRVCRLLSPGGLAHIAFRPTASTPIPGGNSENTLWFDWPLPGTEGEPDTNGFYRVSNVQVDFATLRRLIDRKAFLERLHRSERWVRGDRLAEWLVDCSGLANRDEQRARYDAACERIFAGLKCADFATRDLRPHLVHEGGMCRVLSESAAVIEGTWWDGETRDLACRPALSAGDLREYVATLWLPAAQVRCWLELRKLANPPWLAGHIPAASENAPTDAPTALANAAPSTTVVKAARPKPTHAALRTWFHDRVARWPDDRPPPSEAIDWCDARAFFGDGLTRADFRPVRVLNVPPEWKANGPRKPWGQLKNPAGNSAENSAKLPRQN